MRSRCLTSPEIHFFSVRLLLDECVPRRLRKDLAAHVVREHGAIVPVSVRVDEGLCASLPARLGPDGAGPGLMPELEEAELRAWEASLDALRNASARIVA